MRLGAAGRLDAAGRPGPFRRLHGGRSLLALNRRGRRLGGGCMACVSRRGVYMAGGNRPDAESMVGVSRPGVGGFHRSALSRRALDHSWALYRRALGVSRMVGVSHPDAGSMVGVSRPGGGDFHMGALCRHGGAGIPLA